MSKSKTTKKQLEQTIASLKEQVDKLNKQVIEYNKERIQLREKLEIYETYTDILLSLK